MEALGIPKVEPGNSPFSGFSVRKLKIGSILAFLDRLGLDDTKDQLVKVIQSVKVSFPLYFKVCQILRLPLFSLFNNLIRKLKSR